VVAKATHLAVFVSSEPSGLEFRAPTLLSRHSAF
jgi:hypothetical protein